MLPPGVGVMTPEMIRQRQEEKRLERESGLDGTSASSVNSDSAASISGSTSSMSLDSTLDLGGDGAPPGTLRHQTKNRVRGPGTMTASIASLDCIDWLIGLDWHQHNVGYQRHIEELELRQSPIYRRSPSDQVPTTRHERCRLELRRPLKCQRPRVHSRRIH